MLKFLKVFLIIFNFILILYNIADTFDFDLGWHLRFGKDWLQNGYFPYTDSYTYPHLGQFWVNHEWGGDLLWWILYNNIGFYAIVLLTTLVVFFSFIIIQKSYTRYNLTATFVTTLLLFSSCHIFAPRLAMFSLLFFALIVYSLQNIEKNKFYYAWPIIFWLWSALHGSFTLGFITIGIYFLGNLLNLFLTKYYPRLSLGTVWKKEVFYKIIGLTILSLLTIMLNPYGWHLIYEVVSYFFYDFYKIRITEWVNSFTFPIYWQTGLVLAPALVAVFWQIKKKIISWGEILLFMGLFYASLKYKRQFIYFALLCQPLFTFFAQQAFLEIKKAWKFLENKTIQIILFIITLGLISSLIAFYAPKIKLYKDVWSNLNKITNYYPIPAVEFLKKEIKNQPQPVKVFNEFGWGAYLNWILPEVLIFFDGRGTVTWKIPGNTSTTLETYYFLMYQKDTLKELEKQKVQYVFLENIANYQVRIDKVNRWLFTPKALEQATKIEPVKLEESIRQSKNWTLVYSDYRANIWKYTPIQLETK